MLRLIHLFLGLSGIVLGICYHHRQHIGPPSETRTDDCVQKSIAMITTTLRQNCYGITVAGNVEKVDIATLEDQLRQLSDETSRFFEQVRLQVGPLTSSIDHAIVEHALSRIRVESRIFLEQTKRFEEDVYPVLQFIISTKAEKLIVEEYDSLIARHATYTFWVIFTNPFRTLTFTLWPYFPQSETRTRMTDLQHQLDCREALQGLSHMIQSLAKNVELTESVVKLVNRDLARGMPPQGRAPSSRPERERQQVVVEQLDRMRKLVT